MPIPKSFTGHRFGKWLVIAESHPVYRGNQALRRLLCRCDCGKERVVRINNLTSGKSASCGCVHRDIIKHGHAHAGKATRTYKKWCGAIKRIENQNTVGFDNWGGRGISMDPRWRNSFAEFLKDMGECPAGMTIDRWPNNDGNYEPGNCRWATMKQQCRNKRDNRMLTVRGVTACLSELCELFGANERRVWIRLHRGWPIEEAFFAPKFTRPKRR